VGGSKGGIGVVVVVRLQHRRSGRCTCGWVGKRHLSRSRAIVDALLHASQGGCEPGVPFAEWNYVALEEAWSFREVNNAIPWGAAVLVPNGRA
jgi:hypothetical protein